MGTEPINPTFRLGARTGPDTDVANRPLRFLRFPAVRARTGLSRSTIWRLERHGGHCGFVSRNGRTGTRYWAESAVLEFLGSAMA